jgi:hypothetical protein
MLNRLEEMVSGNLQALRSRLTVTTEDLLERRFIRGKCPIRRVCMYVR